MPLLHHSSRMASWFGSQFFLRGVNNMPVTLRTLCIFRGGLYSFKPQISNVPALKVLFPSKRLSTAATNEQHTGEDDGENFSDITNGDPVLERKLKVLLMEVEYLRQNGERVPDILKHEHWKSLLEFDTRSRRRKYLGYLFGIEKKRETEKKKKEMRYQKYLETLAVKSETVDDGSIKYGLGHNSIFMRIYDATITDFHNNKLIQAMRFSQKLVLDCSYDSFMTEREAQNCAKQAMLMFSNNRVHRDPYDLHLCNISREGVFMKTLQKFIPTLYESSFPLNVTDKSYLEMFERDKLVYLTPHCKNELKNFDHDVVYIIGAMVDKVNSEPLSLAKAKRDNLKMAKLPLDRYLNWGSGGSKSLTLDQMMKIMLDIRYIGDWNQALKHVPRRKIMDISASKNEISEKLNIRKRKYAFR